MFAHTSANNNLPASLGYRMPAEWAPHDATWLAWPHNSEDWPGKFPAIPWVYAEIIRLISECERVEIVINDSAAEIKAKKILARNGVNLAQLRFHHWPTDRVWTRDSGPIFIRNPKGKIALTDWRFNAWAKYDDWRHDDKLPARIQKKLKLDSFQPTIALSNGKSHRLVLEGGSIDVNGIGTLLTTEECLLSEVQQRNPGVSREQLELALSDYLGITQVIWLNRGVSGDDTHGHIDDITRFVSEDTIVTVVEPKTSDENHTPLAENLARLKASRTPSGKQWTIAELPLPRALKFEGRRLPASYANFYILNNRVLVPTFNDKNDRIALSILAQLFPKREVIGVHCVDFIWGLGALHCMTQQQPTALPSKPLS